MERTRALAIVRHERRTVRGTFVGATAFVSDNSDTDGRCPDVRLVTVRLVWDGANFTHGGGGSGFPTDGPLQSLLVAFESRSGSICATSAMYWAVGPKPGETLLAGTRAVDPTS